MKLLNTAKKITTAAALAAALLAGTAPKAAAQCPYTVGPLGRYIAPAIVQGMTATDDGAVEVWCAAALAFCLHWRCDLLRRVRPGAYRGRRGLLPVPVPGCWRWH